uniref:Peptidase M16 C-terminal domain-containing protein n=1 Tax=Anopheles maculatus TaxID=74869 RepID=A0A182TCH4_9DIPT
MQGRENTGESRVNLEMLRAVYPNCGYSSETGGILSNLRTSTTNEKVRAYHAAFYRPDNLHVIITGQINPDDIFKALEPIEEKIVSKGPLPPFERPWQTPVEPLKESTDIKIEYPADEEDCGLLNVAWRGPKATTEYDTLTACAVLLRYLTDTSASPVQREFVEIDDPYASRVSYNIVENSVSLLYISFENVPLGKEDHIFPKLSQLLSSIASGKEKLDMQRMRNVIERNRLEALSSLESNPHDDIAFHVIGDVLYGSDESEASGGSYCAKLLRCLFQNFDNRLNMNRCLQTLKDKEDSFWLGLLNNHIINNKHVVVRAVPSIKENVRTANVEQERLEKQRETLGESGLKEKEQLLSDAMASNEIPPPDEMITSIPVPSTEGIKFYPVEVYSSSREESNPPGLLMNDLPVYAEAYDLHTNFCYVSKIDVRRSGLSVEVYRFYFYNQHRKAMLSSLSGGFMFISNINIILNTTLDIRTRLTNVDPSRNAQIG